MKKILLLFISVFSCYLIYAQFITFNDVIALKWPAADSTCNVSFYIGNNPSSVKYKVSITDKFTGSAIAGRDYEFATQGLTDITETGTFSIKIKLNPNNQTRVINLNIKATSDDTVFNTDMQITLASNPNNIKPIDKTNTPKFEFVTYTDFKGYDPDQPNGIAQSQFLFKIPINRHYKQLKNGETKVQWFRSFILPDLLFNRIDKTNQPVSLQPTYNKYNDSAVVSPVVNSFDFIRYSNFIFNSKLVVLTVMRPKSRFQFQLNGSLYRIKVDSANISNNLSTDSTANSNSSKDTIALNPVWGTGFGAEIYYDTKFSEDEFPFNFRFIFGGQIIKLRSGEYKQADVAPVTPDNSQKVALLINDNHKFSAPIWSFSATIKKNLGLKPANANSEDHYLFFRFNYSWQFFKNNVLIANNPVRYEPRKLSNNFSQFQLGIDLNFDSFFKNK